MTPKQATHSTATAFKDRITAFKHVKANELIDNPRNWRLHPPEQREGLKAILSNIGFAGAILTRQTGDGLEIIDGHLRKDLLGADQVPVLVTDLDDNKAALLLATYDPIAAMAEADSEALGALIKAVDTGDERLLELLDAVADENAIDTGSGEGLTDDDDVPDAPVDPKTKRGELWLLGDHRVLCGDSTKGEDVERLMDGEKINLVFTDPPYGISIVNAKSKVGGDGKLKFGKVHGNAKNAWVDAKIYPVIEGDQSPETAHVVFAVLQNFANNFIVFGGNYFTDFLSPSSCWIIWDKQNTGFFADVEMAWTSFERPARLYQWLWNGCSRKGVRIEEGDTRFHPTQKPVGLFTEILSDFDFLNICDPFLGSGSTLIAAEKLGRRCYGIEISEQYCDVILNRWSDFTGRDPVREDGAKWSDVKE